MQLGAPKPSMVESVPYSVNKTTITCGGSQPTLNYAPAAPATASSSQFNVNDVETNKKQGGTPS